MFARAPVAGQVKTRLAAGIGEAAALAFYRETLAATLAALGAADGWDLALAVTPDDAPAELWPPGVARGGQGDGDLGRRMGRRLAQASAQAPVLIVGSDIPGLRAAHVQAAVAALATADLVIGPASDGGYWLIGAISPPPAELFRAVRWSTADARADTLRNAAGLTVALVDELDDVDDFDGYRRWKRRRGQLAS